MRSYVRRRYFFLFFVATYVVAAGIGPRLGRTEFYPFFHWSLFSYTNSVRDDVVVIVDSLNGVKFDPPALYFYVPKKFKLGSGVDKIRLTKLLHDLDIAHDAGDDARMTHLLDQVRTGYFAAASEASFRIARIRYDPIERLRHGTYELTDVIMEARK